MQSSSAGVAVSPETALSVAAVHACVRIIAGAVATLPLQLRRRIDDRTRIDASDDPLWHLLLILEEGMDYARMAMTAEDAQWIESRKFTRADIAMFFGVPPHMIGDTEKSTSWGTGIEQQSIGFVAYTLEDHLTTWEETIVRDLIPDGRPDLYARFNRAALVKGDIKARWEAYVKGLQWGVWSPNEIPHAGGREPAGRRRCLLSAAEHDGQCAPRRFRYEAPGQ